MKARVIATLLAGVFPDGAAAAPTDDPYAYMEEIEGAKALAFAKAENARSLPQLQNDPRYAGLYADALKIATAKDRIPGVGFAGDGTLRDFWQDAEHVRGVWRTDHARQLPHRHARSGRRSSTSTPWPRPRARTGSARARLPARRTTALPGRACPTAARTPWRCASSTPQTGKFVEGGFRLPEGKHRRRLDRRGHPARRHRLDQGRP